MAQHNALPSPKAPLPPPMLVVHAPLSLQPRLFRILARRARCCRARGVAVVSVSSKGWAPQKTAPSALETSTLPRRLGATALALLLAVTPCAALPPSSWAFLDDARPATTQLLPEEERTVALFRDATPSVVFVTNLQTRLQQRDAFTLDETRVPAGTGSGFVWDKKGHVVTNLHVVAGASDVRVTLGDSTSYEARVVGFDQDKDVAVLKLLPSSGKLPALRPLPVGESRSLQVGQRVYAIGNPFGLDHTLTTGVVSGLGREIQSGITGRPIRGVVQTDAAINPGNSGGPLLDSSGRLVGINTAIYSPSGSSSGIGFAIPVDTVAGIVNQIITTGRVTRPVLGVVLAPDGTSAAQLGTRGVLVLRVPPGSPAAKAGVRGTVRADDGTLSWGDIIQEVDSKKVIDSTDLYRALDEAKPGEKVTLNVLRFPVDGGAPTQVKVTVTLGEQVTQFATE